MLDEAKMFLRYARGLPGYLRHSLSHDDACHLIETQLQQREEAFLRIIERAIYANQHSVYRKLLKHADIAFRDVERLVREHGLEDTLTRLYDAGIRVTLDEFKGRKPIERSGLTVESGPRDFDNPLLLEHFAARSSGSRGVGTRVIIDLDLLNHEAAYISHFYEAFHLRDRPVAAWRPIPPVAAGIKLMLRLARIGVPIDRWFSQNSPRWGGGQFKFDIFTRYTVGVSRFMRKPIPAPIHVAPDEPHRVLEWLDAKKRGGELPILDTTVSSGVRLCRLAQERGVDLGGTFFRFGGEPLTAAKARVVEEAEATAHCHYSMAEIGIIALACASPTALDDVHLMTDKIAAIQRQLPVGSDGQTVGALVYTTVLPSCPKLMLNVESDDYAVVEEKKCDCPLGEAGFSTHLSRIRSYGKLTSEGVTFLGTELLRLVEETLPARFGGAPTDYQFVEEEIDGLPRVSLVVSPRVKEVEENAAVSTVFGALAAVPGGDIMADQWRNDTLHVVRKEPYRTHSAKILPLHIETGGEKK